jgi:hypothetical protein
MTEAKRFESMVALIADMFGWNAALGLYSRPPYTPPPRPRRGKFKGWMREARRKR